MSRFFRSVGDSDSESSSSEEELMSSGEEEEKPAPSRPAGGMSRFLRTAGSDSSSDESDESDESMSDDDGKPVPKKKSRFEYASDDEESEDEVKRVVKSAKDKRVDEMEACAKSMDNALKINDWVAISSEFDKLIRLVQRQTNVAERVPGVFMKTVISLEASVNTATAKEKEAKKKMNQANAKALVGVKKKIKMAQKEHEGSLKQYQEDPEAYDRVAPEQEREATRASRAQPDAGELPGEDADDNFTTVGKGGKSIAYTAETVLKNLVQIQEARGKKATDRQEQIKVLEKLLEVSQTSYQQIRVLLAIISARFDYNPSAVYMPLELWTAAKQEIDRLISMAGPDSGYSIEENPPEYDDSVERSPEGGVPVHIRGSIISFLDRLDDEFTKSLQNLDPHGTEYVERLKDEAGLYVTVCRCQQHYEARGKSDSFFRAIMRRIEHIYSKPSIVVQTLESAAPGFVSEDAKSKQGKIHPSELVHQLCAQLYQSGNSLLRTRSMLWHIYHHALYNNFHAARDMLLMSHLQENIHAADVPTQILFNRAIVQLGLCAFRSGLIKEAQSILLEIFSTQRVKELLAQGMYHARYPVLTPEQEKAEKLRQMPFHMHINTELLEGAFLVSSMLIEIPMIASIDSEELKRKMISKPFRRLLDFADRQTFSGPPETTRDHIMQASKALRDGDWKKCRDLILGIQIWSLMPEEKQVKEMLSRRIQEEGLRTYLHTFASQYTTLSLTLLSRTFDLSPQRVRSIVSRLIWTDELSASLDQSSEVVIFHRVQPSKEQRLALSLSDRINQLVEHNEKTLDLKLGGGNWQERSTAAQSSKDGVRDERSRTSARGVTKGAKGSRFAQGLGNRMGPNNPRSTITA